MVPANLMPTLPQLAAACLPVIVSSAWFQWCTGRGGYWWLIVRYSHDERDQNTHAPHVHEQRHACPFAAMAAAATALQQQQTDRATEQAASAASAAPAAADATEATELRHYEPEGWEAAGEEEDGSNCAGKYGY